MGHLVTAPEDPIEVIRQRLERRGQELAAEREARPPAPDRLAEITAEVAGLSKRFDGMTAALVTAYERAGEAVPADIGPPRHLRLVGTEDGAA